MNKEHLAFLVKAYTENTISREEYDELLAYIAASQSEHELTPLLQKIWDEITDESDFDERRQQIILQQITGNQAFIQSTGKPITKVITWRRWFSVAAGLLFLSVTGVITWHYLQKTPQPAAAGFMVRDVPYGKKIQMQLPDGSQVWVNSGSSIRYPVNFSNTAKREIFLEGEAFFDVVHDTKRPFIIHTGKVATQVLGTAFDIRAYGANNMSVTVARGKVSVGTAEKLLSVLTPDQAMNYSFKSGIASTRHVDASKLKWMNGELALNNTTLKEAAQDVERWYNVHIDIDDTRARSKDRRFSATFLNHENIDQVLKILAELSGFSYQRNNNHITIKQH